MRKKWKNARVIRLLDLSSSVKGLDIQVEDEELFEFIPGQFVTLDLPIGQKRLDRWRSYSIANTSNKENIIQLAISYIEGGRASEYFFNTLREGDILILKGPEGVFCLPKTMDKKLEIDLRTHDKMKDISKQLRDLGSGPTAQSGPDPQE